MDSTRTNNQIVGQLKHWIRLLGLLCLLGCTKAEDTENIPLSSDRRLLVVNEGTFQFGNASLSLIDHNNHSVEHEVFQMVNNRPLGDIAQSATIQGDRLFVVVNNSGRVEVLNKKTFNYLGTVDGLTSPRYLQFYGINKALVTNLFSGGVDVVNTATLLVEKNIPLDAWSEQMVAINNTIWISSPNRAYVYLFDAVKEELVDSIFMASECTGIQQMGSEICLLCSDENETISLNLVDTATLAITRQFNVGQGGSGSKLVAVDRDQLIWLHKGVRSIRLSIGTVETLIEANGATYYGLSYDQPQELIWVTDAKNYVQKGQASAYDLDGNLTESYTVGINPTQVLSLD